MVSNVSISKEKINIHTSFDTSLISPINCGGIALNLVFPQSVEDLRLAVKYANERKLKLTVLGSLTNTLILAPIIEGLTIVTTKLKGIKIEQNTLVSFAGESINKIVNTSIENNLSGLESLAGLPGSLGGALFGNAGAFGSSISDYLESIDIMLEDGSIIKLKNSKELFSYRKSNLQQGAIIISATFSLNKCEDRRLLLNKKNEVLKIRKELGHFDHKSLGCVFKNPNGKSAGLLIDSLGLKGLKFNSAEVSNKHGNFITFTDKPNSEDYIKLALLIKERIKAKTGIDLEFEIQIIN